MTETNSGPEPSRLQKLLLAVVHPVWLRLVGQHGERWRLRRPIFMVGCPRSGTGLALALFAQHPDVTSYSEAGDLWDPRRYNDPEADHVWTAADVTEEDTRRIHSRFECWRRLQGRPRFINKHPRNSVRIGYLRAMFADALILHVIRDGRAVVHSLLSRVEREPHRREIPFWNFCKPPHWRACLRPDPVEQAALQWREIVRHVLDQRPTLGAAYHQFRYEDLCAAPRETLAAAFRFADLRVDPSVLARLPETIPSRDDKWRRNLTAAQIETVQRIQGPLLKELGYET